MNYFCVLCVLCASARVKTRWHVVRQPVFFLAEAQSTQRRIVFLKTTKPLRAWRPGESNESGSA
jgi:hypothetical protein